MKSMKTLSVALMAIGLSTPALADGTFFVPSQHGGFKVAVDPLYLRNSPGSTISDSSFDWGVFAQVGYLFPQTGNDLTVDYTYLRSGDTATMDLDTADLEIGQRLSSGAFDIRLFSGVRYAHLNSSLNVNTPENPYAVNNLFHGFGPRLGVDARYRLADGCFGLDTHLDTAFLIGKVNSNYQSQTQFISESMSRVVPEVDAKLGIDYTYCMSTSKTDKSLLVLELGYQTSNYVHALNNNFTNGSGDANLDGVYLDVKYYS